MALKAGCKYIEEETGKSDGRFATSALVAAIRYGADNGAHILNMSLGGGSNGDTTFREAVNYAIGKGVLIVAAAGNNRLDIDKSGIVPASFPGVITVSSVNNSGSFSLFSNYGDSVDFAAPGEEIWSTYHSSSAEAYVHSNAAYAKLSGTSMSTPHVAGLFALILGYDSTLQSSAFQILKTAAIESSPQEHFGSGIVNAKYMMGMIDPSSLSGDSSIDFFYGPEGFSAPVLNFPNPFNPKKETTGIFYSLTQAADIRLRIYSLTLSLVKEIVLTNKSAGDHIETWDGRDSGGDVVPNGVYMLFIDASSKVTQKSISQKHKIVVLQ